MGAKFLIGFTKTDWLSCSLFTKGIALFILIKKVRTTLIIKEIFSSPKIPPKILFTIPKAAKLAIFVKIFPANETTMTMITNVEAKAPKEM